MEQKKIDKIITKAVKSHSDETPAEIGPVMLEILTNDPTVNAVSIMNQIKKAFKAAGIIAAVSVSNLGNARKSLVDVDFSNVETYKDMVEIAENLQADFNINEDANKGISSGIKLVKNRMKELDLPVPKKVNLGMIAELKIDYYNDEDLRPSSVEGLAEFLIANCDVDDVTRESEEFAKKMKITAGTDFSYSIMLRDGLTLKDING